MEGIVGKCTVAYLDILGFKQKVDTLPISELAAKYENVVCKLGDLLNQIEYKGDKFLLCKRFIFSDSIILISDKQQDKEHWKDSLGLLIYAWKFLQISLAMDFPIRGGIAYGEVYINEADNIFLGNALTKAYELEQQQEWIGVSIDPSVFEAYPELKKENPLYGTVFFDYPVPLKNAPPSIYTTLNWRWNLVSEAGTRSFFKPTSSPTVQLKQYNTLEYVKKVKETVQIYPEGDQSSLSPIFRTFWAGNSKPPFEHGDDL